MELPKKLPGKKGWVEKVDRVSAQVVHSWGTYTTSKGSCHCSPNWKERRPICCIVDNPLRKANVELNKNPALFWRYGVCNQCHHKSPLRVQWCFDGLDKFLKFPMLSNHNFSDMSNGQLGLSDFKSGLVLLGHPPVRPFSINIPYDNYSI